MDIRGGDKMRNISLDLTKDGITMPIFCGYDGEHRETTLLITLPENMVNTDYIYKIMYQTAFGQVVEDNDYHILNSDNKLTCTLYQQVMEAGILRIQVIAYKQDESDSSKVEVIAKSQKVPLLVRESVSGEANSVIDEVDNSESYWAAAMSQIQEVSRQLTDAEDTITGLNDATESASVILNEATDTIETLQNILNASDADRRMNLIKEYLDSDANPESDFSYTISNHDTVSITGYNGSSDKVVIPHIINNRIVTYIASFKNSVFSTVIIPNTVTGIGMRAFENCESLRSVIFEDNSSLRIIDEYAFLNCHLLSSAIEFPETLVTVGGGAFGNCSNLSTVIGKNTLNITSWGEVHNLIDPQPVFYGCSSELTLYEGKGHALKDEANLNGYGIKKYVESQMLTDLLYSLETCDTYQKFASELSDYLSMSD